MNVNFPTGVQNLWHACVSHQYSEGYNEFVNFPSRKAIFSTPSPRSMLKIKRRILQSGQFWPMSEIEEKSIVRFINHSFYRSIASFFSTLNGGKG